MRWAPHQLLYVTHAVNSWPSHLCRISQWRRSCNIDTAYHIVVLHCPCPDVDYLPIPHPPSLSCTSMQTLSQLHSAHLGHLYAPKYPHEEHIRLGGVDGARVVADKYGGTGSAGYRRRQDMSQSVFKVKL